MEIHPLQEKIMSSYFLLILFELCIYIYIFFFLKNHLYKNVQAEINQILRYLEHTQGVTQSRTTLFFPLIIFVCEKYK